ncbi:hypothetical protein GCM10023215_30580 [Pseudonocardia yuanmonensis]|uniref:AMP-binding enzyme C-terminal domain-containing protein n=1 Tax=Pseudonocardia yuanmonensis TaxID=1095914 RepID=A0ABP8WMK3_9PSEU
MRGTGGGFGSLLGTTTPPAAVTTLLQEDASSYTWVAAAAGSNAAAGYQLAAGAPVMAVGGFNGTDPAPTLARFQQFVAEGRVHWFVGGAGDAWFHTGDALRQEPSGEYFYVDRVKDSIRRRGENISSYEVEVEVQAYPGVDEAAAIAVPSELGEDDVMVVVVPRAGAEIDPAELLAFLVDRMPHYMVPRYVRVVDALPRTPTMKVQKARLRAEGPAAAWDREAAGIRVRREAVR